MKKTIATFLIIVGALAFVEIANAQQAIFLVRHAEDQRSEKDRPLSDAGRKRALLLASVLKDAGIKRSLPAAFSAQSTLLRLWPRRFKSNRRFCHN